MAEEPSLSYYLPIAGERIIGFIPFPRVLVQCEMQSVSSRIWTRIAVFISYGDNDYTAGTSKTTTPRAPPKRLHHGHLCGETVIVVRNGLGEASSNPERDLLHFKKCFYTFGKIIHPTILQPTMG